MKNADNALQKPNNRKKEQFLVFILFLSALFCSISFFSPGAWAQISHDDLTRAIVENHTFRIDRFITDVGENINTGDWSSYDGHYYSNKAPGASFLAALFYYPVFLLEKSLFTTISPAVAYFNSWWFHLFISILPFACGCVLFYLTLRKLRCSVMRSAILAEIASFCTPLWAYSSANWSHTLAATCLLFSFYELLCALQSDRNRDRNRALAFAGCACGYAFLSDYGSGAALPVFVFGVLWQFRKKAIPFFLGALLPALLFCWYHWICFGTPFTIASFHNNPIFTEPAKTGGIFGAFSSYLMLKLLIGSERGIFWSAPVLLFAIPGVISYWKQNTFHRKIAIFLTAWIFSGLLANSAFNGWHAGSSVCARYLIFTLPAFGIALAGCRFQNPHFCRIFAGFAALSWLNMLVINAVTPFCSDGYNPLYLNAYPQFFSYYHDISMRVVCAEFSEEYNSIPFLADGIQSPGRIFGGGAVMDILLPLIFTLLPVLLFFRKQIQSVFFRLFSFRIQFKNICNNRKLWLLLLTAAFIFFLYPLDIIWVNDEPVLLRNALYYSDAGNWCPHGLVGSFGVSYGPFPTWIYQLLLMFSENLPTITVLKTILYVTTCFALLYAIAKETEINPVIPIAIFLLSPWLRNYARCLWDNIFLVPISLTFLLCILRYLHTEKFLYLLYAAVLCVLAISIHSMAAPLAGGILLFFLFFQRSFLKKHFFHCSLCAIPAAIFSGFILLNRLIHQTSGSANDFGSILSGPIEYLCNLFEFTTLLTPLKFCNYYIPNDLQLTWIHNAFLFLGIPVFLIVLMFALAGIHSAFRFADYSMSANLARLSLCILITHLLFFGLIRIRMYPHYHMAAVMPYLSLASCGAYSFVRKRWKYHDLWYWLPLPSLCLSLVFTIAIHRNAGTRDFMSFGPTLAYQWQTVTLMNRQIASGATLNLQYDKNVMPYDTFPLSLDVLREYEDIAHGNSYPDVPISEPLQLIISPPATPSINH